MSSVHLRRSHQRDSFAHVRCDCAGSSTLRPHRRSWIMFRWLVIYIVILKINIYSYFIIIAVLYALDKQRVEAKNDSSASNSRRSRSITTDSQPSVRRRKSKRVSAKRTSVSESEKNDTDAQPLKPFKIIYVRPNNKQILEISKDKPPTVCYDSLTVERNSKKSKSVNSVCEMMLRLLNFKSRVSTHTDTDSPSNDPPAAARPTSASSPNVSGRAPSVVAQTAEPTPATSVTPTPSLFDPNECLLVVDENMTNRINNRQKIAECISKARRRNRRSMSTLTREKTQINSTIAQLAPQNKTVTFAPSVDAMKTEANTSTENVTQNPTNNDPVVQRPQITRVPSTSKLVLNQAITCVQIPVEAGRAVNVAKPINARRKTMGVSHDELPSLLPNSNSVNMVPRTQVAVRRMSMAAPMMDGIKILSPNELNNRALNNGISLPPHAAAALLRQRSDSGSSNGEPPIWIPNKPTYVKLNPDLTFAQPRSNSHASTQISPMKSTSMQPPVTPVSTGNNAFGTLASNLPITYFKAGQTYTLTNSSGISGTLTPMRPISVTSNYVPVSSTGSNSFVPVSNTFSSPKPVPSAGFVFFPLLCLQDLLCKMFYLTNCGTFR